MLVPSSLLIFLYGLFYSASYVGGVPRALSEPLQLASYSYTLALHTNDVLTEVLIATSKHHLREVTCVLPLDDTHNQVRRGIEPPYHASAILFLCTSVNQPS